MSLRDRKKLATREALSNTAFRLVMEQGIDAVTPEAVADAVGVSPRTFRNYFSCREEAVFDGLVLRAGAMVDALRARPAGEPVWDSLLAVLPAHFTEIVGNREDVAVLRRLVLENPAMFAQNLTAFERIDRLMAETIAERTGRDIDADLEPALLASCAGVALRTAVDAWPLRDDDVPLPALVTEALGRLREGLPIGNEAGRLRSTA
jgi:AcrR family transcriptional regulator